ncbi:hypothetical protein E2C01_014852 [Portunus trituberculatus]|uniref:Uncharacterized protein n=1 Tax=Portunus trituberculatus TaxID=210409 RepID=A0A5B7DK56_PORTR|nr:hypothetical protein [Portunus trituberculatus]
MLTPNPASESPSEEGNINVPRSDFSSNSDPKCLDTSLNLLFIHLYNIPCLKSNFQSVEHHLSSTKPHLFLTETQRYVVEYELTRGRLPDTTLNLIHYAYAFLIYWYKFTTALSNFHVYCYDPGGLTGYPQGLWAPVID